MFHMLCFTPIMHACACVCVDILIYRMNGCCDCNVAIFLTKSIYGKVVYVCWFCPLKALLGTPKQI